MRFERFDVRTGDWAAEVDRLPGGLVCHTPAWLSFLERSQHAEPVAALLRHDGETVGAFAGAVIRRMGLRILGSPFPGWTTSYMGLDLLPGVSRREAIEALIPFAWNDLRCVHLEMMDRQLHLEDLEGQPFQHRSFNTWEVDLRESDDSLLASFSASCRTHVRRAIRSGLVVEEAHDDGFVDDYYAQLTDVFARQRLVPTYPRSRVEALIASLPPDKLLLLRARTSDGQPVATGIFHAVDRERAFGWGYASFREHQHLRPNELLMFRAMNEWRARGLNIMDLGGAGEYKRKYHPRAITVPWIRTSRYPFIAPLREMARRGFMVRQRALFRLPSHHPPHSSTDERFDDVTGGIQE